jgi:hypothetical protein
MSDSVLKTAVFSMFLITFAFTHLMIQVRKNYQQTGTLLNKDVTEKIVATAVCIGFIIWVWYGIYN